MTGGALDGQWTVVTGGSKGIGYGIAERFVDEGAHVVLVARDVEGLEKAAVELRGRAAADRQVHTVAADVSGRAGVDELFDRLAALLPVLNVFVANVGYGRLTPFLDVTDDEWDGIVATNLSGTFRCTQAAARLMRDRPADNRAIVVISSIRAQGARAGVAAYAATKAGLNQLARVAALELAPLGIRMNTLSPGLVVTPMSTQINPDVAERAAGLAALGRPGVPADSADGVLYLATAPFVTGTDLVVDGGESLA